MAEEIRPRSQPKNPLLVLRECELPSWQERLRGFSEENSVVQNHVEQRFMNMDTAVVLNKAELAKAIHEEADAGACGPDHIRQSFLRNLWN